MFLTVDELLEAKIINQACAKVMSRECDCGFPILRNRKLTKTICSNPNCPNRLAERGNYMFDYLGVKGIGPATCKQVIKSRGLKSHLSLVPLLLDYKPEVYLWEIAKMACIDGLDSKCEEVFGKYKSFKDYFDQEYAIPQNIAARRYSLQWAEEDFIIKEPLAGDIITVAIHGSIPPFSNRSDYIGYINGIVGKYIHVVEKGANLYNQFLITYSPHGSDKKLVKARQSAVTRIVTPQEFEDCLIDLIARKVKGYTSHSEN